MSDVPEGENKDQVRVEQQPSVGSMAMVQCEGFSCLAYRDVDAWRDFKTGKKLLEVKEVLFTFSI